MTHSLALPPSVHETELALSAVGTGVVADRVGTAGFEAEEVQTAVLALQILWHVRRYGEQRGKHSL